MTEQHYRVIADRDKGADPQWGDVKAGDRYTADAVDRPSDDDAVVRIERPVPNTDEPPVADTSSGEHRRVIRHVGDDLPICDTCINVLGLNVRWDHAVLRHEREGITPAEPQPSPSLPTREQIAKAIAKAEDADYWVDELRTADAVLALLQKEADR